MATQYQGDMTATQAPSPLPSFTEAPIGNLPADGDTLNASSVIQDFKACLDYLDFLRVKLKTVVGIRTFDAGWTYAIGDVVRRAADGFYYRCIQAGAGHDPTDVAWWLPFALDLGTLSAAVSTGITPGVGTITNAHSMNFPATTHHILSFRLEGIDLATPAAVSTVTITIPGFTNIRTVQVTAISNVPGYPVASVGISVTIASATSIALVLICGADAVTGGQFSVMITGD